MSVQKRNILGDPVPSPSSGDGASGAPLANPLNSPPASTPKPSAGLNSRDALAGLSREHGDHEGAFRSAADRSQGVADDGSQGSGGFGLGGDTDDAMSTTGSVPDQQIAYGTAGTDKLVQRDAGADTGQAFGKAVG